MKIKILIICFSLVMPVFVAAESAGASGVMNLKEKADRILYKEVLPNMKVKAIQNGQELTEKNSNNAVVVETLSYAGLEGFDQKDQTLVNFSGTNVTPNTPLYIYFSLPNKMEKSSTTSSNGSWQMDVSISNLSSGNHTAYLQVELDGVRSSSQAVANFNIISTNHISRKTWYFLSFVVFAIIILLFAIILQLHRNAKYLEPGELI